MKKLYELKSTFILLLLILAGMQGVGQVTTDYVINITKNHAYCGYTVAPGGGTSSRGIELSDSAHNILGNITAPLGEGFREDSATALNSNTTYNLRAYESHGGPTNYGSYIQFKTYSAGNGVYPYQCILINDYLILDNTLQFDVYIYSTNEFNLLYLNNYQIGLEVHNVGTVAGTLTGTLISSGLPTTPTNWQPAPNLIFRVDGDHFDMVIAGPAPTSTGTPIPAGSGAAIKIGTFQVVHKTGGSPSAFPTGVQLQIVFDSDVLGKTIIYATPGANGTPVNVTSTSSHSPREPISNNNFAPSNNYMCNALNWKGTTSTDWTISTNWFKNPSSIAAPPGASTFSYIEKEGVTNWPEISNTLSATCGALDIDDGAKLTIKSNGGLTVSGNMVIGTTASGPLVIESDASGSGSLITNGTITGSGVANCKVQRYLASNAWHLISAPISDAKSGIFADQYLMPFIESSNSWGPYITSLTTSLTTGQGFICWPVTSQAYPFTGTLNTGNISAPGLTFAGSGFNLVGNPYPSAIDWELAKVGNTTLSASIWIWNQAATVPGPKNYGVWNGTTGTNGVTQYIPVGQGFFVQAIGASPALSMNDNARVHNTQPFLKSSSLPNSLRLHISSTNGSDEVVVYFDPSSSWSYNPQIDSKKMYGDATAPQLYSFKPNDPEKLSINVLPELTKPLVIPIGFEAGVKGDFTMTVSQIESFSSNVSLYLEDLKLNKVQDLRSNPVYTFNSDTTDLANRFNLHLSNWPYGLTDHTSETPVQIYGSGKYIFIESNSGLNQDAQIFVYDIIGRNLYQSAFTVNSLKKFDLNLNQGYYIVKIVATSGTYTKKVFISK